MDSKGRLKRYVVGFLFTEDFYSMALIRKARPEWQRNLLNGIGGKVELGETEYTAMVREFHEETGALVEDWTLFARTRWDGGYVDYFFSVKNGVQLKTMTDEEVLWVNIQDLRFLETVPNLTWTIPMAIACAEEPFFANVCYNLNDPAQKLIEGAAND